MLRNHDCDFILVQSGCLVICAVWVSSYLCGLKTAPTKQQWKQPRLWLSLLGNPSGGGSGLLPCM